MVGVSGAAAQLAAPQKELSSILSVNGKTKIQKSEALNTWQIAKQEKDFELGNSIRKGGGGTN
jgi:hypothetical protein